MPFIVIKYHLTTFSPGDCIRKNLAYACDYTPNMYGSCNGVLNDVISQNMHSLSCLCGNKHYIDGDKIYFKYALWTFLPKDDGITFESGSNIKNNNSKIVGLLHYVLFLYLIDHAQLLFKDKQINDHEDTTTVWSSLNWLWNQVVHLL